MGDEALEEDVRRALERKEGREITAAERMTRERSLSTGYSLGQEETHYQAGDGEEDGLDNAGGDEE